MKSNPNQFQQGDLVIEKIKSIPESAAEQGNRKSKAVFLEGEGHHLHRAATVGDVSLYIKDGIRYARVHRETQIEHVTPDGRHGEHNPITLPTGDYQFGQVFEYDYLQEMARNVID